ncbi:MAG: hypothetical protein DMD91_11580, partial [Candidatus Rokuibacteriota bacterium]
MDGMVANDELVSGIRVLMQHSPKPLGLDMAFPTQAGPGGMDEDHEEVATPHPVRETVLSGRTVPRHLEDVAEHRLAHLVVGGVVAGGMPDRNGLAVEPAHFVRQPVLPLGSQRFGISGQATDLIAREENEVRRRRQSPD